MQGRLTRNDVVAIVKSHVDLLERHVTYVGKIFKNQLSLEEISDYISVLIYRFPVDDKFKVKYAYDLQCAIQKRLQIFRKMLAIISDENENLAICGFYLALKCELAYAACDARIVKNKSLPFSEKIQAALNCADSMKKILAQVKQILPPEFELLSQCIEVKEITTKPKRNGASQGLVVESSFIYRWSQLNNVINEAYGIDTKTNKRKKYVADSLDNCKGWMEYLTVTLTEAGLEYPDEVESLRCGKLWTIHVEKVHARTMQNNQLLQTKDVDADSSAKYDKLYENIKFFYDILPIHLDIYDNASQATFMLDVTDELAKEILKFKREYEFFQMKVIKEHAKTMPRARQMKAFLFQLTTANNITRESDDLGWFHQVMDNLDTILRHLDSYLKNIKDEFDAMICQDWFESNRQMFTTYLDRTHQFLAVLDKDKAMMEKLAIDLNSKKTPAADVCSPDKINIISMQEPEQTRESFEKSQAEKTRLWKEKVAQKQQTKSAMKQALQPKQLAVTVVSKPDPVIEHHWRETLLALNEHYFDVLNSVLSLEGKVTYQEIYHLITNHLNGSVEEYGSSHKRIRIAAYCAEITGDGANENHAASQPKLSKTTGGMWKPHNTANHYMQRFNLELVACTLIRAGINSALLDEVTRSRQQVKSVM